MPPGAPLVPGEPLIPTLPAAPSPPAPDVELRAPAAPFDDPPLAPPLLAPAETAAPPLGVAPPSESELLPQPYNPARPRVTNDSDVSERADNFDMV